MKNKKNNELLFVLSAFFYALFLQSCVVEEAIQGYNDDNPSERIVSKIQKMAKDYDISIDVTCCMSRSDEKRIDFQKIENLFSAMSSVRGSYKLHKNEKLGENSYELIPKRRSYQKTRSFQYEGYGTENDYSCNFADTITGLSAQIINRGSFVLTCRCVANCHVNSETGYAESFNLNPSITSNAVNLDDCELYVINPQMEPCGPDGSVYFEADINYGIDGNFFECDNRKAGSSDLGDGDTYDYYHNLNNAQNDNVYYTNSEDYCYFNSYYFNAYLKIVFKLSVTGLCKKKGGYITWSFREN